MTKIEIVAILVAAILSTFFVRPMVEAQKIDALIDLVVSVDARVHQRASEKVAVIDSIVALVENFEIGEDKTRIAIVSPMYINGSDTFDPIVLNKTGDSKTFDQRMKGWTPTASTYYYYSYHVAFMAMEKIFADSDPRAKIAVVFNSWFASDPGWASGRAGALNERGAWLYVVSKTFADPNEGILEHQSSKYTTPSRLFVHKDDFFDVSTVQMMSAIKDAIHKDLCTSMFCRFDDNQRKSCNLKGFYFRDLKSRDAQCPKWPQAHKNCNIDDCEDECDRRWKWNASMPNCCGRTRHRIGPAPPEMENCLVESYCEPCPTTKAPISTPTPAPPKEPPTSPSFFEANLVLMVSVLVAVLFAIFGIVIYFVIYFIRQRGASKLLKSQRSKKESPKSTPVVPVAPVAPKGKEAYVKTMAKKAETSIAADLSIGATTMASKLQGKTSMVKGSMVKTAPNVKSTMKSAPDVKSAIKSTKPTTLPIKKK